MTPTRGIPGGACAGSPAGLVSTEGEVKYDRSQGVRCWLLYRAGHGAISLPMFHQLAV